MNKLDLARSLARQSHRSRAKAADDVDSLVHKLLKDLEQSNKASEVERKQPLAPPKPRPNRES